MSNLIRRFALIQPTDRPYTKPGEQNAADNIHGKVLFGKQG